MVLRLKPNSRTSRAARGGCSYPAWLISSVVTTPFLTMLSNTNRARLLVTVAMRARRSCGTSRTEQIPCGAVKGGRDFVDIDEAYISFAALHTTDISAVKTASERQRLLGKPFPFSDLTHAVTEVLLNLRLPPSHFNNAIIMDDNKSTDFKYPGGYSSLGA